MRALALVLSVLLATAFVAAAGTSTGGVPPPSRGTEQANTPVRPCADRDTPRERILCRLQQREDAPAGPDESCRGLGDAAACQSLYQRSAACYDMTGRAKDRCFRTTIGFATSSVRDEASRNQGAVREYAVLILYDLQERVEEAHDAGTVSDDDAADLIDEIVQAKQAILQNKSKDEIRAAITAVKTRWREVMM